MKVLNNMLDQEFISQSEYDEAVADNVYDRIQLVNVELQDNGINSYFIDELTDQSSAILWSRRVILRHRHTRHSTRAVLPFTLHRIWIFRILPMRK